MLARRKERLDELGEELGDRAVPVPCDVTDLEALEAAIGEAADTLEGLDAVITVAGQSMAGSIATGTPERWRELMDLNLIAPLATVHHALKHFPESGRRDVVLIGSTGSITPHPAVAVYGSSKRGLRAAFESLRLELAPAGVNTSIVIPGMFETEGLTLEGIVIDGEPPAYDIPMFVPGSGPAPPAPLADTIAFMIGQPEGICINEMVVRPTGQLNP